MLRYGVGVVVASSEDSIIIHHTGTAEKNDMLVFFLPTGHVWHGMVHECPMRNVVRMHYLKWSDEDMTEAVPVGSLVVSDTNMCYTYWLKWCNGDYDNYIRNTMNAYGVTDYAMMPAHKPRPALYYQVFYI